MAVKNCLNCLVIGVLAISLYGCKATRAIDENNLVIIDAAITENEENHSILTLKIKGDYAESAWGIKHIRQETVNNMIVLTGTLELEGQGAFEYDVNIPPHVDVVKFYERILWTRNQ